MIFRRIALFLAMACGLVASQLPEFAQQYRQRLGGALDELHNTLEQFDRESTAEGLTRPQGVARLEASQDRLVRGRGRAVRDAETREKRLGEQLSALQSADPLGRLVAVGANFDSEVARRAMQSYEPAVPVTTEGFGVGLLGFVAGLALIHFAAWPVRRRSALRREQEARRELRIHST